MPALPLPHRGARRVLQPLDRRRVLRQPRPVLDPGTSRERPAPLPGARGRVQHRLLRRQAAGIFRPHRAPTTGRRNRRISPAIICASRKDATRPSRSAPLTRPSSAGSTAPVPDRYSSSFLTCSESRFCLVTSTPVSMIGSTCRPRIWFAAPPDRLVPHAGRVLHQRGDFAAACRLQQRRRRIKPHQLDLPDQGSSV